VIPKNSLSLVVIDLEDLCVAWDYQKIYLSKIKLTVMSYALTLKHKNPLNNVNSQYAKAS
jgi:hypothetical protein